MIIDLSKLKNIYIHISIFVSTYFCGGFENKKKPKDKLCQFAGNCRLSETRSRLDLLCRNCRQIDRQKIAHKGHDAEHSL